MKKIIISPYAQILRKKNPNDPTKTNPKNYPFWKNVVSILKSKGYYIIQIGLNGEESIGANETKFNCSLSELKSLLDDCNSWISVDSFFQHFATFHKKKGVVIFSKSDPNIFGYDENINLLKDRGNLRVDQFGLWESVEFNANDFVAPYVVIDSIEKLIA